MKNRREWAAPRLTNIGNQDIHGGGKGIVVPGSVETVTAGLMNHIAAGTAHFSQTLFFAMVSDTIAPNPTGTEPLMNALDYGPS